MEIMLQNAIKFVKFSLLLIICFIDAQKVDSIETKLLWFENNDVFYSNSIDTYIRESGFVEYDSFTNSVTEANYQIGYFLNDISNTFYETKTEEFLQNQRLINELLQKMDTSKNIVEIKFNDFWKYALVIVTMKKKYLGSFEMEIPILNNKKSSEIKGHKLNYKKIKIPLYYMAIINIEPYYK